MSIDWQQVGTFALAGLALLILPKKMTLEEMILSHQGGTYNEAQQTHAMIPETKILVPGTTYQDAQQSHYIPGFGGG